MRPSGNEMAGRHACDRRRRVAAAAMAARAETAAPMRNLAGETCRMDGAPSLVRTPNIVCGESNAAVGTVRMAAAPQDPRQVAVAPEGAHGWRTRPARARMPNRPPAARRNGSGRRTASRFPSARSPAMAGRTSCWPRPTANSLYEADGMPAMLPVLAAALSQLAGAGDAAAAIEAGTKILSAKLPADVLRAHARDAADYKHYVEAGGSPAAVEDYAAAENAYRHALDIETKLFGPDAAAGGRDAGRACASGQQSGPLRRSRCALPPRRADSGKRGRGAVARAAFVLSGARRRQPAPFRRRAETCPPGDDDDQRRGRRKPATTRPDAGAPAARRAFAQSAHRSGDGAQARRCDGGARLGRGSALDHHRGARPAAVVASRYARR